ncbi:MAG TPA: ComEA family DNA-binding protein [Thermoleophilaceae bacterium]|nr:ComEA family DNA-binding protein [Thermoleophilaceae bacterium]
MAGESRGTVVVWVVAAVLGVLAFMRLTGSGDEGEAGEPVRVDRSPGATTGRAPGGTPQTRLYVHVAGAVRRPGLVRVPAGSRVAEALFRAGGPSRKADLTGVNLAAQVEDGQQVVVPAAGAVPGGAGPTAAAGTAAAGPTAAAVKPSLGSATVEQLDEIDGIGPTLAERIVEYRSENGGFGSLDELQDVDGIGEKRLATLREALQP